MNEDTREQLLNVLFNESETLEESEALDEGFLQNVGNTIKTKAAQTVNNIKANVGAQVRGMAPAFTTQQKAKRAAAVQNIKTTAQTKNDQLSANLNAQKAANKFQKNAIKSVKNSAKQASQQYKSLSAKYSNAKNADAAFANVKPNDVKSVIEGICAAFCGLQIYGNKENNGDMKDMAKNAKDQTKTARKNNKQSIKNAGQALKGVAQDQADAAHAEVVQGNAQLESVQWSAYKMFTLREDGAGQFAKQGVINLLSNFIAFNNADVASRTPSGDANNPSIGDSLINAIIQARDNLIGGYNYLNDLNDARTGEGGPVVYKNVKVLYKALKALTPEALTSAVTELAKNTRVNTSAENAVKNAPAAIDTGDPVATEKLNNAIQGLSPAQLQAFITAANKLQIQQK